MAQDPLAGSADAALEWASATRALDGAPVSGDCHVVVDRPGGILLALIDGLGHGAEAAAAARAAAAAVERYASHPLPQILRSCHEASLGTRGSAITLAAIDFGTGTLMWAGVGNVAGVVLRADASVRVKLLRGRAGIVGSRLPALHAETVPLDESDMVLLASDGIRPDFADPSMIARPLQRLVDGILKDCALESDDALVLAARYHRAAP